jgi:hypothetical protein
MVTSPSQSKDVHDSYSTSTTQNPPEGKTTAVIAMMRGKPKDGYHHHHSNKQQEQKLVQVLLESGSDGELVFVSKDKPMLLPYSLLKKAGSTVVEYFKWDLPAKT